MMRVKLNGLIKTFIILSFMLFAADALGMGWYILGASFLLTAFYIVVTQRRFVVNSLFVWVLLLAVSNFAIMFIHSNADIVTKIMKYLASPLIGYLIGHILASEAKEENAIFKLYMYAVIPLFVHGVLNQIGFQAGDNWNREVRDFWTGQPWKATLHCAYFAMTVPLVFLSFTQKGLVKKAVFFGLTAFSVYASIATSSRTVIFIGLITIALEFLLYLLMPRTSGANRKKGVFLTVSLAVAVVAVIVFNNMDSLSDTYFFQRMFESDVDEEPRIRLFMNIIKNTLDYPLGNMPYFYSHNTWLDFLRESGWITFICFAAITVIAIKDFVSVYKRQSISQPYRVAVVGMMTALLIVMFVEPIMDGSAILFCLFFYFIAVNNRFAHRVGSELKYV